MKEQNQILIPHLFRQEFGKIVATLTKYWGIDHLEVAEDIAADTFLKAMETWPYRGVPENPVAWLHRVARNLCLNYHRKHQLFQSTISKNLYRDALLPVGEDFELFESGNIRDSQLRMLFAISGCDLPQESRITLALRILGGFSIDEIAHAFMTSKEAIQKRLFRAKEKLRKSGADFMNAAEVKPWLHLDDVLTMLYLLYNEGYYSESNDQILRKDLCLEALRLTALLTEDSRTDKPEVSALLALMSFHASRFEARINALGEMVLYEEQDLTKWNSKLIEQGIYFLNKSATGNHLSKFHLEAAIAYHYTRKENTLEKWMEILNLFDRLLEIAPAPVVKLNRIYAFAKVYGNKKAIAEATRYDLPENQYYYLLLGVLYREFDPVVAADYFQQAAEMTSSVTERNFIRKYYQ